MSDNLQPAMQMLVELGQKVQEFRYGKPCAEPGHIYYVANGEDGWERVEAEPQPRKHTTTSLETLVAIAKEQMASYQEPQDPEEPARGPVVFWVSRNGVVCLLDDQTRRDRVDFSLHLSKQMELLGQLEGRQNWMSQTDFVRLLRISLAGTLVSPELLTAVRRVKFRQAVSGERVVEHGKSSLGRSIESELTGSGILPEEVRLCVRIWDELPEMSTINCALEIDSATEKFFLVPLPGELELAIQRGEASVYARLEGYLETMENPPRLYLGKA